MPNTPIYGFTYLCEADPVDPAAFALLASQIDAKLLEISADADYATGRYNSIQSMFPNQAVVNGVETPLTNAGSTYTVPVDGIYIAEAEVLLSATTVSDLRLRVTLNTVAQYGRTIENRIATAVAGPMVVPGAPLVCAAGDVIGCTVVFGGTGAGTCILRFNIRMILRLA